MLQIDLQPSATSLRNSVSLLHHRIEGIHIDCHTDFFSQCWGSKLSCCPWQTSAPSYTPSSPHHFLKCFSKGRYFHVINVYVSAWVYAVL